MLDPNLRPLPPVTHRQILSRGLRQQCPNCGHPRLFRSTFRIHHRCPGCGMTLERGDGFFLGPLCLNYGAVAFFFAAPVLITGFAGWVPANVAVALALGGALLLPALLYRWSWSLWLMLYYLCLPGELHANRPEDSDDLSFDEENRS